MRKAQLSRTPQARNAGASLLQRQCACGSHAPGGACGKCGSEAPPIVRDALKSPARSLDTAQRVPAERQFGQDLSHIRVHTGETAAASAQAVGALAYSVGPDLVFGAGQFAPSTRTGERLLTHEIAHAVQQPRRWAGGDVAVGDPSSAAEREADSAARNSASTGPFQQVPQMTLQRQANPAAGGTTPADFGISLVVVDHGATDAHAAAEARLQEIYSHVRPANLAEMKASGITKVELHVIPEDTQMPDLPEFSKLKGVDADKGRKWSGKNTDPSRERKWDTIRGEGGIREGSTIRIAVGEEKLIGTQHHGASIGLGIGLGAVGAAGLGFAGAEAGISAGGSKSKNQLIGGIIGGAIGALVGGLGGSLGGYFLGKTSEEKPNGTGTHESAHSVELFAFTKAQHDKLAALYSARIAAKGLWLPPADYTSSDVHEYWAQSSKAFFRGGGPDDDASAFSPEWLKANDPGMFALLNEVYTNPQEEKKRTASENQSTERTAA
jgi:hypothetical protein